MWPQVPDINTIKSAAEAMEFARQIKALATAKLRDGIEGDERDEVLAQLQTRDALIARASQLSADAAALAALEADTSDEATAESETENESEGGEETDGGTEEAATKVSTSFGVASTSTAKPEQKPEQKAIVRTAPEYLFAVSGVQGKNPGDAFESWAEVAKAAAKRGASLNPASTERFEIARIKGNYEADRVLSDDVMLNAAKFEMDELTATFCPPATPHYNIACANVLRRPVFASLPAFQAPRGRVSIMPSPALSDITTGYGDWTSADDGDVNAVKSECQTITCGSPTEYEMYGVYKCLTVKNMMAMTYPELVEAYLNRLGAATARYAEELMLNAMATAATSISAPTLGYGGAVTITSTILNYLALYQETQRWDVPSMHIWLPRWVLWAMKMDVMRRRRTDGAVSVPSDGQIEAMFREVGISSVTWFIDRPTWAVAIPSVASANTLNLLPATVQLLIAPEGKFAAIDRGELAIGVTGNNIYRDNESNRRNQFTFFFENFEGVVNTTSCPAHILSIPACWNGAQIDDIVINCQGGDEAGYQS